jgi:hypothetical protein
MALLLLLRKMFLLLAVSQQKQLLRLDFDFYRFDS